MISALADAAKLTCLIQSEFVSAAGSKGREPYLLINELSGDVGSAHITGIIRSFDDKELDVLALHLE